MVLHVFYTRLLYYGSRVLGVVETKMEKPQLVFYWTAIPLPA